MFLDRDGVLNEVVYRDGRPASPRAVGELVLADGASDAVARLRAAGFRVFVVTNQPDVARGLLDRDTHDAILDRVGSAVGGLDALRACTHDDADDCGCRKPRPGLLLDLGREWNVDLGASYVIGDSWKDIEAGRAAGCTTILVERPYNAGTRADLSAPTLAGAVDLILRTA